MKVSRLFLILAGISGMLAVVLGALGSHALKPDLTPDELASFETGVRYHFYHTLALIATAILFRRYKHNMLKLTGWAFLVGIICFSGSIYLLSTRHLLGLEKFKSILGPITPVGGLLFVAGWLFFSLYFMIKQENK